MNDIPSGSKQNEDLTNVGVRNSFKMQYRHSSIKPHPGMLIQCRTFQRGLIRDGGLFTNQSAMLDMIAFQLSYPIFCGFNIQFTRKIDKFNTVLSQNISKLTCKLALLKRRKVFGKC